MCSRDRVSQSRFISVLRALDLGNVSNPISSSRLWKNRNEFQFKGRDYDVISTLNKAKEDAEEWKRGNEVELREVKQSGPSRHCQKWKPPPATWLKCNSDGSWQKDRDHSGVGWVCRDQNGSVVWAGAKAVQHMGTAIECEAEAIRWAVATLSGFGYRKVIVETDSLVLCKMIRGEEEIWPVLKPIVQSILYIRGGRKYGAGNEFKAGNGYLCPALLYMLEVRQEYHVEYYLREGNKVADRIAKESSSFMNYVPKLYSVTPMWLKSTVEADMPMEFVSIG
ncbi:uncharacterized protein LOC108820421 [Raphanus sativus]|uniref:Uncharacterized protein LOC108820421 n=1 Tax=Raphanus sativus TaxID=3726 RepID=A0A9W3CPR0_RAPSA|nr:uncharacterized protein LOC108820421 [Raphanus sativus]